MNEETMVRARDLRPGDVIAPDYHVLRVEVSEAVVSVLTQRPDHLPVTGLSAPDQWLRLVQEGP
jgi:hypothetical protein